MDDTRKRATIAARLSRARDDLATARDDLYHAHWRGATNRAYYAEFHAVSAVLLWLGIERARHSGVQAAFGESLIKPGIIEPEYGHILSRARKMREEQDYDLEAIAISAEDASRIIEEAARLVSRMERTLRDQGALP